MCRTATQPRRMGDGLSLCVFQGAWLVYFAHVAILFWLFQALDVFLLIVKNSATNPKRTKWLVNFAWGFPALFLVPGLATQAYGSQGVIIFCVMNPESLALEWFSIWIWAYLYSVVGTALMVQAPLSCFFSSSMALLYTILILCISHLNLLC